MSVASRASFSITKTARRRTLFVLAAFVWLAALAAAAWETAGRLPWPRAVYGQLLEGLARQQPAAIVFDILFIDPQKEHLADDLYFVRTATALPNVSFPMVRLSAPPPAERGNAYLLKELKNATAGPGADPEARAALLLPLPGLSQTGRLGPTNVFADAA